MGCCVHRENRLKFLPMLTIIFIDVLALLHEYMTTSVVRSDFHGHGGYE